MFAAALVFLLLAVQPAPITIADCLLRDGYSRGVLDTPVTTLAGGEAWGGGLGERAILEGEQIGWASVYDVDGARRMIAFYAYAGDVFAFVFMHPDNPARRLPGEPDTTWHGSCMLRIAG